MTDESSHAILISQAVEGDRTALCTLLWRRYDRLLGLVRRELPADLRTVIDPEDIVQEVHIEVFQRIGSFRPQGEPAFSRWLTTITEHRLLDVIKAHRRRKRGGDRQRIHPAEKGTTRAAASWVDAVARWDHTPSRSFARRELEQAIQTAVAGLDEPYREALRMRELEGLPVAEIARRMNRTKRAVHNLCWRARQQMRAALGRASRFLTEK